MQLPLRPFRALAVRPSRRSWIETAIAIALFGAVFLPIGLSTGLLRWAPLPPDRAAIVLLVSFLIPSFGEEFVFRGFIPGPREGGKPSLWIGVTCVLFIAWHWAETLFMPERAEIFLRADFLAQAACLGLVCGVLRHRSGSLWPPVLVHWAVAGGWLALLGGPALV